MSGEDRQPGRLVLPTLGEASRPRRRLVSRTPKLVAGVVLALLALWGWAFSTWRFEVAVEVAGRVVESSPEGAVVELTLAPTADRRVPTGALGSGLPFTGALGTGGTDSATAHRLTGVIDEVVRLGDQPTLRGRLDPLAPDVGRPRVGAPVAGHVVVRSATGFELLTRRR